MLLKFIENYAKIFYLELYNLTITNNKLTNQIKFHD